MAINLNDTYTLLQALEQSFAPTTLLRDTFFPNVLTSVTEEVLIDYKKGVRRMSPFVVKGASGVNVSRIGFETKSYKPPLMMPQRPTTIDDISKRAFGENVFSARTPAQRAIELRFNDMLEMQEMNTRRIEWMCSQLMLFGEFQAAGYADDGKTQIIDTVTFPDWTQKLTLTGTDVWTNINADAYSVLQEMSQTIVRNGGRVPTVAIGSYQTMKTFMESASVMKYLLVPNRDNLALMSIAPQITSPGVMRVGYIQSLNLELYAYDGIYIADDGSTQQYIPDGYLIMGVTGRGSQLFGAVIQLESDGVFRTYEGRDVPKVWNEESRDVQMIRLASRCIPKPEFIDDWYTVKVF
jgi:hypothetical protein